MSARPRKSKQSIESHRRYMHYYMQSRADKLKDEGLCVICGQREPREEKVTCQRCIDKQVASKRRARPVPREER